MTVSQKSKSGPAKSSDKKTPECQKQGRFPIVGIGASAGGLEALELFLKHVPEGSGMAFVIVQHLDPTHKGIMVELMQRATPAKLFHVKNRMRVEANRYRRTTIAPGEVMQRDTT